MFWLVAAMLAVTWPCTLVLAGQADFALHKCLPKADMQNVAIKCGLNEVIAIKQAFFTSSIVDNDQSCPFTKVTTSGQTKTNETSSEDTSTLANNTSYETELDNNEIRAIENEITPLRRISCTDDLRITLNSR